MGQSLQYIGPHFKFDDVPMPDEKRLVDKNQREVSAKLHALHEYANVGQSIVIERPIAQVKQAVKRMLKNQEDYGFLIEPLPSRGRRQRCRVYKTR